jgi:hypothetical protein
VKIRTLSRIECHSVEGLERDIENRISLMRGASAEAHINALETSRKTVTRRKHVSTMELDRDSKLYKEEVLVCPSDTVFELSLSISGEEADAENVIIDFIKGLSTGEIRLGENTTLGCGICYCTAIEDLEKDGEKIYPQLPEEYIGTYRDECKYVIVDARSYEGIMIRNNEEPEIPASTWKGIFRKRVRAWLKYMDEDMSLLDEMFGNRDRGIKGQLVFYDSTINEDRYYTETRVHIDKFSGAAIESSVKSSEYMYGRFEIRIDCLNHKEEYKSLIAAVLRDFQFNKVNVGADMGIGKGFISIEDILDY